MSDSRTNREQAPERDSHAIDETVHDEHPVEPAEGARHPGTEAASDVREHPSEPAEGPRDNDRFM